MARILVLEDDDALRGRYARELEANGHQVFQAARFDEAGDELESGRLDFVLVDINRHPAQKARELMQILLRDGNAHRVINVGHNGF
jgi:DNA-binding response OmpR family regulator